MTLICQMILRHFAVL